MRRPIAVWGNIFVLALLGTAAQAGQIITIDDVNGNLGTVNTSTGASTVIGNAGHGVVLTDIAFNSSGQLFGIDFSHLYSVNKTTGAATLIGGLTNMPAANGLTFSSTGTLYASDNVSNHLYTVNTTTGVATDIGKIGPGFTSSGDLAFNGGNLYMSSSNDHLIKITLSGGVVSGATDLGAIGFSNVYGLATGADGALYGVAGTDVFSINTSTGHGTLLSDYGGHSLADANGASFDPTTVASPEPATLGLLSMNAACLLAFALRRKPRNKDTKMKDIITVS